MRRSIQTTRAARIQRSSYSLFVHYSSPTLSESERNLHRDLHAFPDSVISLTKHFSLVHSCDERIHFAIGSKSRSKKLQFRSKELGWSIVGA
jgi:hypothetical protein